MVDVSDTNLGEPKAEQRLGLVHRYSAVDDPAAPLIVLVHGRAGTVDVMWTFRRFLPQAAHIVSVQGALQDPQGGYNWWPIQPVPNIKGQRQAAAQRLKNFIYDYPDYYGLQPSKVIALGFSQGGGILSSLLQEEPEIFHGLAILCGFVLPVERPLEGRAYPPVFMAHGTEDEVIPIELAREGRDYLTSKGIAVHFEEGPTRHKLGREALQSLEGWLKTLL